MNRHAAAPTRARRAARLAAGAAAVAWLLLIGASVGIAVLPGGAGTRTAACRARTTVRVLADPAVAPLVRTVAARSTAPPPGCVRVLVTEEASATSASRLTAGTDVEADVWIPDSTLWAEEVDAARTGSSTAPLRAGPPIASSPVVLAAAHPLRTGTGTGTGTEAAPSWRSVLDGTTRALLPDPRSNATSVAALSAMQAAAGEARVFAGAVVRLAGTSPPTPSSAFLAAEHAATPTVVVTDERTLAAFNAAEPAAALTAVSPSEGTVATTFPFVPLHENPGTSTRAVLDLQSALVGADEHQLEAAGLRAPLGSRAVPGVGLSTGPVRPAPSASMQRAVLDTWEALRLRSRVLALVDVSGSMTEPAGGGDRRIDLFLKGAAAAFPTFSGAAELGIWAFSADRASGKDWDELTPVAPVTDPRHDAAIARAMRSIPHRIGGDTGLYDTVLAAVRRMHADYRPGSANAVLVLTDGANRDPRGIGLPALLAELHRADDPDRPVPVTLIGFGPHTDLRAMRQIADATGGTVHSAATAADFEHALVDALSRDVEHDAGRNRT